MKPQHLSDEAVAAFADGVLDGFARQRAARHTAECPECAYAVAAQREAVWALRAAPAPALPTDLLQRLRDVPQTTPLSLPSVSFGPDGSSFMASFGSLLPAGVAAVAPAAGPIGAGTAEHRARRHVRPIVGAAVAVAAAGVLVVSSAAHASSGAPVPSPHVPAGTGVHANVQPAGYVSGGQHR